MEKGLLELKAEGSAPDPPQMPQLHTQAQPLSKNWEVEGAEWVLELLVQSLPARL